MQAIPTRIPEVLIIEPQVFGDARGFFFESFNQRRWQETTGVDTRFVQDNHSRSEQGVLRGRVETVRKVLELRFGALDNAVGVASMLEVARLLVETPPARPVLVEALFLCRHRHE